MCRADLDAEVLFDPFEEQLDHPPCLVGLGQIASAHRGVDSHMIEIRPHGAFLVSARRTDGRTDFVRIKSLAGEPCCVCHSLEGDVKISGVREVQRSVAGPGRVVLDLRKGEEVVLWTGDTIPECGIGPVRNSEGGVQCVWFEGISRLFESGG